MPKLNCSVTNCANNCDDCCCLGGIDVSGDHASTTEGTCCSSFCEQGEANNAATDPNPQLQVKCGACNCVHNNEYCCKADYISISGQGASRSTETECGSFCTE